jgi:chemotaxis protein histidine kinase CheA
LGEEVLGWEKRREPEMRFGSRASIRMRSISGMFSRVTRLMRNNAQAWLQKFLQLIFRPETMEIHTSVADNL